MSQVFGIDFGTQNIVISTVNTKSKDGKYPITVIENGFSKRKTIVSFSYDGEKLVFGEASEKLEVRNYQITISSVIDLIGCKFKDLTEEIIKSYYPSTLVECKDGRIGFDFKGKVIELDEIIILLFHEISEIIRKKFPDTPEKIPCVICVPSNFKPAQIMRVGILAQSSNFTSQDVIPSYVASSLMYGFENQSLYKNVYKNILLCDCGYTNLTLCYVCYRESKMTIYNNYTTDKISGKLIDMAMLKYFAPIVKENVDIDIFDNAKAYLKVKKALISVKEKLSAAGADEINISIDFGDDDVNIPFSRAQFEKLLNEEFNVKEIFNGAMNLTKQGIPTFVLNSSNPVVIGGTMRIPLLKRILLSHFSSNISLPMIFESSNEDFTGLIQTLNMDECASCGSCVYQIADKIKLSFDKTYQMDGNTSLKLEEARTITKSAESKIKANEDAKKVVILRNEIEAQLYEHQHEIDFIRAHVNEAEKQIVDKLHWLNHHKKETYDKYSECFEEVNEFKFLNSVDNNIIDHCNTDLKESLYKKLIEIRHLCDKIPENCKEDVIKKIISYEKELIKGNSTNKEYNKLLNNLDGLYNEVTNIAPKLAFKYIIDDNINDLQHDCKSPHLSNEERKKITKTTESMINLRKKSLPTNDLKDFTNNTRTILNHTNIRIKTNEKETYKMMAQAKLNDLHEAIKRKVKNTSLFDNFFKSWNRYLNIGWNQKEYQKFGSDFDDAKNNIPRMSNENDILSYLNTHIPPRDFTSGSTSFPPIPHIK